MDRIAATLDELKDSVQPAISAWDFGGKMRDQIQLAEPDNISDIEAGEFFVVRNVQENALWVRRRRHACASFPVRWSSRALLPEGKFSLELVHKCLYLFLASLGDAETLPHLFRGGPGGRDVNRLGHGYRSIILRIRRNGNSTSRQSDYGCGTPPWPDKCASNRRGRPGSRAAGRPPGSEPA